MTNTTELLIEDYQPKGQEDIIFNITVDVEYENTEDEEPAGHPDFAASYVTFPAVEIVSVEVTNVSKLDAGTGEADDANYSLTAEEQGEVMAYVNSQYRDFEAQILEEQQR